MILHYFPKTRAFPVLWALEEFGAKYRLNYVNLSEGKQRAEEFRCINPMMKVPALEDGDTVVTETGAILLYLGEKVGNHDLLPAIGEASRAPCLKWLFFVGSDLEPAMAERFQEWPTNPYYNGWGDFDRVESVIAAALAQGPWLLGSQFTIADIYLAADLRVAGSGNLISAGVQPYAGSFDRIRARPAFARAVEIDETP